MKQTIITKLEALEKKHTVVILYAVESGSRAWGFASPDSDYDVRFIYIHPTGWYLSIADKKNVIELPIENNLDINGWDIRKALHLFRKSNPTLLEWLNSPICYKKQALFIQHLRDLLPQYFSPRGTIYHYLHMAENNYKTYLQTDLVKIKKYFYVLRPILACMWIERYNAMAPVEFEKLYEQLLPHGSLKNEIIKLLERKIAGDELSLEPQVKIINDFLDEKITHFRTYVQGAEEALTADIEPLDSLFHETLKNISSL